MEELSTKKAAKKIIKRAKKHPEFYTKEEVYYAKLIKKTCKKLKNKTSKDDKSIEH
tara:strand:- start:264 stop:431 length:168 start_codon:yes stop_codon:yes gene_type:complete